MSWKRKLLHLTFLLMLLAVSVSIDLFHDEKDTGRTTSCPACTFHLSSIVDSTAVFISLPIPALIGMVELVNPSEHEFSPDSRVAARSPPSA
jgi:hypothetical protein